MDVRYQLKLLMARTPLNDGADYQIPIRQNPAYKTAIACSFGRCGVTVQEGGGVVFSRHCCTR